MAQPTAALARTIMLGELVQVPVAAGETIYEGSAVGLSGGYARQYVAGDLFAGFAEWTATGGAEDGDATIRVRPAGRAVLTITGTTTPAYGVAVYATDGGTFTADFQTAGYIGRIVSVAADSRCEVDFDAQRARPDPYMATTAGLNRLPIEWVEQDYAAALEGATLASDARRVIQYAWTLTAASGARCSLGTPGVYALDSSEASDTEWPNGPTATGSNRGCLIVASGLDFEAGAGVILESAVSLAGARGMVTTDRGDYRQAGQTPPEGITIRGGVWRKRAESAATGNIFGIEADALRLVETIAEGWSDGRAYNLAGNGHRHYRPGMRDPAGELQTGGMRFWYGDDFDCDGLWGESGDDAAQFVTAFGEGNFWYGDITNAWYRNARVTSNEARGAAVGLPAQNGVTPTTPGGMSNRIKTAGFVDCLFVSGPGGIALNVQNQNSSNPVEDIVFRRCVFDMTATDETAGGFTLAGAWGGVKDVLFDACTMIGAARDVVVAEGRIAGLVFRNCRFYAPRDESSTFRPMRFQGVSDLRFEGGFAEMMATAPGDPANALVDLSISTGTATYSGDTYVTTVDGAFFGAGWQARNIRSAGFAIRTTRCDGLVIDGMKLVRAAGASASQVKALSVTGSSNGSPIIVRNSDFTDSTADETDLFTDSNGIVVRDGWNLGVKAPVQTIANASNDNGIIGPGVKRAEITTTSAGYAITLGAPTLADRFAGGLEITMVADGGFNVTMALTNVTNLGGAYTTATFGDVGDTLLLRPAGSAWWLLANSGVVLS